MPHTIRNYQSPYTAESFWTYVANGEMTLALFVKITPNTIWSSLPTLGFTSLDYNVTLANHDDLEFVSSAGLNISTIEQEAGRPANLEITGVFENQFTEVDVLAGKWNNAQYEAFVMNYNALGMGEWVVLSGIITKVKILSPNIFKADVEGLSSRLATNFGTITSKTCRTDFGSTLCKKNLAGTKDTFNITKTLTVHSVPSRKEIWFTRIDNVPNDWYDNGKITGVSGNNADIAREIRNADGVGGSYVKVYLKRAFPLTVTVGDTFSLVAGCDNSLERCRYWENVVNFRGEPFIPGVENASRLPPVE